MIQRNIFLAFFRCGILGYGGGPSIIPLMQKEVVEVNKWMSNEEFAEVVALANTLPGPLLTKMAGYLGHRVGGARGCANALLATSIPTAVLMIVILTTLAGFQQFAWVQGMSRAMTPVVAVMMGVLTWQFLQTAAKTLKWPVIAAHVIAVYALTEIFGVHPAGVIGALLVWALFGQALLKKLRRKDDGQ